MHTLECAVLGTVGNAGMTFSYLLGSKTQVDAVKEKGRERREVYSTRGRGGEAKKGIKMGNQKMPKAYFLFYSFV